MVHPCNERMREYARSLQWTDARTPAPIAAGASARNGPERRDRRETKRFLTLAAEQPRLRIAF
jgi:hypothetical protein